MNRLVRIILIVAVLSCGAAVGLRQTVAQRGGSQTPRNTFVATAAAAASVPGRPHENITVTAVDGSFVLKNLLIVKAEGSAIIRGSVVNKTNGVCEQVSFRVRAYDVDGRVLKGLESETIFTARKLKANRPAPINHGYGVWLQGIEANRIARIEVSEFGEAADVPIMARLIPLASHALDVKRYDDVEE